MKRRALDAGLDVSTHSLRHACATHLLQGGADLEALEIEGTVRNDAGDKPMTRSLTARFFPRNILSH